VLLGQTLALSLNTRFDSFHEGGLGDLELCKYMTSLRAIVHVDGQGNVTEEQAPLCKGNVSSRVIPEAVLAELDAHGGRTVNDLLALANRALAGEATDSTLDEINQAVSAVNELFDECRFLIYCDANAPFNINSIPDCPSAMNLAPGLDGAASPTTADAASPTDLLNPFSKSETVRPLFMRDSLLSNMFRRDRYSAGNS